MGDQKMTHLEFKRQVMLCLLKQKEYHEPSSSVVAKLPQNIRFNSVNHFWDTESMCTKGNIRLHEYCGKTCFNAYPISC